MIDLWESHPAFSIPRPSDVHGAFSTPSQLAWRFGNDDNDDETIAEGVAADNALDDELLNDYISRCRLAFNFDACRALAGDEVERINLEREGKGKAVGTVGKEVKEVDDALKNGGGGGLVNAPGGAPCACGGVCSCVNRGMPHMSIV